MCLMASLLMTSWLRECERGACHTGCYGKQELAQHKRTSITASAGIREVLVDWPKFLLTRSASVDKQLACFDWAWLLTSA